MFDLKRNLLSLLLLLHFFFFFFLLLVLALVVVDEDEDDDVAAAAPTHIDDFQTPSPLFLQSQPDKQLSSSTLSKSKSIKSPPILLSRRDHNYTSIPVQSRPILSNNDEYLNREQ